MQLYDVPGYSTPKLLSPEHAEALGATPHRDTEPPKRNASRGEWAEYALELDADPSWVEQATRQDLLDAYGG